MAIAAISVAPDVSPIKSPVARGFLNSPCNAVPDTASILPTNMAITIRESLTSHKIYLSLSGNCGSCVITFHNTANGEFPPKL